ncbi:MAG: recombinase family protein [Pseudomonadota bacterium]
MLVGYARTSTLAQDAGLDAQRRDLDAAGCEKVFAEQVSSVDRDARGELAAALDFIREGDVLVATKMDRLARSVPDLLEIVAKVEAKGAGLRILANGDMDTTTPTGRLMVTMLGAVAEFERSIMLERQREGIAKAKAAGKYRGRTPTARAKAEDVRRLRTEGKGATAIARELGIGRASVYRILEEAT